MAKKTTKSRAKSTKRARPAAKRDLVRRPKASAYAKRTATGRFKELDDVGQSQKIDKRRKAKRTVGSGFGDQGDQRSQQEENALTRTAEWAGATAAYVARGIRAAAATIGLAQDQSRSRVAKKR